METAISSEKAHVERMVRHYENLVKTYLNLVTYWSGSRSVMSSKELAQTSTFMEEEIAHCSDLLNEYTIELQKFQAKLQRL